MVPERAGASPDPDARQAMAHLYASLDRLSDDERLAFVLRHLEGLELVEVAAALGCSLATAKRRLSRGSERLLKHTERDPVLRDYLAGAEDAEGGPLRLGHGRSVELDPAGEEVVDGRR
jgi:RNA polymerase sigma-70 factor (ECF subfamily)